MNNSVAATRQPHPPAPRRARTSDLMHDQLSRYRDAIERDPTTFPLYRRHVSALRKRFGSR